ncbi:histidinol dehydrogenase, chloroplastic-like [Pistacia vera]|uniref:histidinol dehydrogenase, chloroplastic-like n=1 Tax=Pistacia vera TaxID=55513 RepID=UPI00126347CE|nr:histidinol dehydrogenase, chloroplastic-like [Pistacia vera]
MPKICFNGTTTQYGTVYSAIVAVESESVVAVDIEFVVCTMVFDFLSIFSTVHPIVADVRNRGDASVKDYTERFDKVNLTKLLKMSLSFLTQRVLNAKGGKEHWFCWSLCTGGTAVLPSTALMLSVPAQIAGCKTTVLATPPSQDGGTVLCQEAGVTHILKAGGAQVEKIFGPGNQYVTAAKMILQAEHGPEVKLFSCNCWGRRDLKAIEEEISKQCNSLPRESLLQKLLATLHSNLLFNLYAPEHLIVNVKDAEKWECFIENALNLGSVFLGPWTPKVWRLCKRDNHVLPTYGYARMYSGFLLIPSSVHDSAILDRGRSGKAWSIRSNHGGSGRSGSHKRAVTLRLEDIKARQVVNIR